MSPAPAQRSQAARAAIVALCCAAPAPAAVRFVDASASAGGNGAAWGSAFQRLQDALAVSGVGDEVRVAQGLYTPGPPGAPRESTFPLADGVTLRGGYAGLAGADPDARDPLAFTTTLSGDLGDNDTPGFGNRADNAFHVVSADSIRSEAVIDGVRIAGGAANGPISPNFFDRGGGVFARALGGFGTVARVRLIGCTLQDNSGVGGAGAATLDISFRAERCTFADNTAPRGAGFTDQSVMATPHRFDFIRCVFERNAGGGFGGGGILCTGVSYTLSLSGCRFTDNTAPAGAGVYTGGTNDHARAINCLFDGNTSQSGPAWFDDNTTTLRLINCTMTRNTALLTTGVGSVVRLLGLTSVIANSVIHGNAAPNGAITAFNSVTVRGSDIQGGFAGAGNIDADPFFRDPAGGDYRLRRASPCADAGANADVLADEFDLDADGDTAEPTPADVLGALRFIDDPGAAPNGAALVDMGALERQLCPGDATDDLAVTFADLNLVLSQFGQSGPLGALAGDVTGDGAVNFADLNLVLSAFGGHC